MTFVVIVELKYLIVSVVGFIFTMGLIYGIDQARRENNIDPKDDLRMAIRKALVRYTLLAVIFALKITLAITSLSGLFGEFGLLILSTMPDLLFAMVFYEWRTDILLMHIRKAHRTRPPNGAGTLEPPG